MYRPLALLVALTGCAAEQEPAPTAPPEEQAAAAEDSAEVVKGKADGAAGSLVYASASGVEALKGDVSSLDPPLERIGVDRFTPQMYLRPMSCLGYFGPVGPYGPLGLLGPVGEGIFNPSSWVTASDWHLFAHQLTENDGPLSAEGPLGDQGPLNVARWGRLGKDAAEATMADEAFANDFVVHLQPGGVFGVLGPVGPLGALGPLGPLGPIGAHGYATDLDGRYVSGDCPDNVCRSVDVKWTEDGEVRTWPLFEHYGEEAAADMPDNDTSFMVSGTVDEGAPDAYVFGVDAAQWVTVTVVPEYARFTYPEAMTILGTSALIGYNAPYALPFYPFVYAHRSNFDDLDLTLTITGADGAALGQMVSNSADRVDWIQTLLPAGAQVKAHVEVYRSWWQPWRVVPVGYRLIVVGATQHVQSAPIFGGHVQGSVVPN